MTQQDAANRLKETGQLIALAAYGFAGYPAAAEVPQSQGSADPDNNVDSFIAALLDSLDGPDGIATEGDPGSTDALKLLLGALQPALSASDPTAALLAIGHIRESLLAARGGSSGIGRVYTPHTLAISMSLQLLKDWESLPGISGQHFSLPRILDPACGSGAFLLCCAEQLLELCRFQAISRGLGFSREQECQLRLRIINESLHGCDTDAAALQLCKRLLSRWATGNFADPAPCPGLLQGNALSGRSPSVSAALDGDSEAIDWLEHPVLGMQQQGYDFIIGNPPYVDSENMSRSGSGLRSFIRENYSTARGNWDLFIPFIERGLDLLAENGRLSFVVPARSICADYAASLQDSLLANQLERIRLLPADIFPAARVWTVVLQLKRCKADPHRPVNLQTGDPPRTSAVSLGLLKRLPAGYISAAFSPAAGYIAELLESSPALGDFLSFSDGCTTQEAYSIAEMLQEDESAYTLRLLNTGTIDPFTSLWGRRTCRYLSAGYTHPAMEQTALAAALPRRLEQAMTPKLLLAGLASRLECLADTDGTYLCGKAAVQAIPHADSDLDLHFLSGLLNSRFMCWLYRSLFGLRAYSSKALNIGPRQLELLPLKRGRQMERIAALAKELADAAAQGQESVIELEQYAGIEELVMAMYGVDRRLRRIIEETETVRIQEPGLPRGAPARRGCRD